jgi:hypothetical protein
MTSDTPVDNQKGWALLKSFLRDKPIVDALWTTAYFALHPLRFTDEVIAEDWTNKAKPPRFLIETLLLSLALLLLTPFSALYEPNPAQSALQQDFLKAARVVIFCIAFFAACGPAHLILGARRLPFIRALYLFCYVQGASLFFAYLVGSTILLIQGQSPSSAGLLVGSIVLLFLGAVALVWVLLPIRRAYDAPWYKILLAAAAGLPVYLAVAIGLARLSELIASRLPPK